LSIVKTSDGGVRINAEEGARAGVYIDDGSDDVILEGVYKRSRHSDTP
jgi:hypothetical protein